MANPIQIVWGDPLKVVLDNGSTWLPIAINAFSALGGALIGFWGASSSIRKAHKAQVEKEIADRTRKRLERLYELADEMINEICVEEEHATLAIAQLKYDEAVEEDLVLKELNRRLDNIWDIGKVGSPYRTCKMLVDLYMPTLTDEWEKIDAQARNNRGVINKIKYDLVSCQI